MSNKANKTWFEPYTSDVKLLDVKGLEQKIKLLKQYEALPGITQDEETFDRFIATTPRSSGMVV